MFTESAGKFMEALKNDPKAKELLKGMSKPKTKEEIIAAYIDLAGKLGITLSEEDAESFVAEEKDVASRSEIAAKAIQALPDDELENVAGGKGDNPECKDTYEDRENCWITDGCDILIIGYEDYSCSWFSD